ncbi:CfrBI family restriction endonuclease [candidate division KSB1 bacterium]|nr:CfrBI family restriction endonuclease [candidate division KSB1 bacterium]
MNFNYRLDEYRSWLEQNVTLSDPFSIVALKKLTHHLLMGKNYRLLTEANTRGRLFSTYLWLSEIQKEAKKKFGDNWLQSLFDETFNLSRPRELKDLLFLDYGNYK